MVINQVEIQNFTVFQNIKIEFAKGVNVLIGENGTGKTHLLKILNEEKTGQLTFFDYLKDVTFDGNYKKPIFIPAKDMLTHSKGFIAMSEKFSQFPFDKTLIDIVRISQEWQLKEIPNIAQNILPKLETMMGGKIVYENEEFYIEREDRKKIPFSMEAEGFKKIGLIWQLLMTENITKGTVLLWDEPESNINPKFIPMLVEIVLELSRNGVQVFLATHSYFIAKYLEIRKKESDDMLFHSLYKSQNDEVLCESNKKFSDLKNNIIMEAFEQLLDEVYEMNKGE